MDLLQRRCAQQNSCSRKRKKVNCTYRNSICTYPRKTCWYISHTKMCPLRSCSLAIVQAKTFTFAFGGGRDYKTNDQAVKSERLSKDENQNHAHEEAGLLSIRAHSSIA